VNELINEAEFSSFNVCFSCCLEAVSETMNNRDHRRILWEQVNVENYITGGFTLYAKFVTMAK